MRTEQKVNGNTKADGIRYDEESRRYETPWGWIRMDFATGDVQIYGPGVNGWFDPREAERTAALFTAYASPGMAMALAIHQQYAAWKGARQIVAAGAAR